MNRREQILAIAAAAAILLLLGDAYVIQPITQAYAELDDRRSNVLQDLRDARNTLQRQRAAQHRWGEMIDAGLAPNASAAESQALHAMRTWAADARLDLASMQPDRRSTATVLGAEQGDTERIREIELAARGSGSMESVARLFYQLETADIPVRINRVRLTRLSGSDDGSLSLELRASTIYRESAEDSQ